VHLLCGIIVVALAWFFFLFASCVLFLFFFLIRGTNPTAHLRGPRLKSEQASYGLSPSKLAPEEIEPQAFGGVNSKIPSQPLGQTQMGSSCV